ncbi:MAG: ABC transporter permease, partial [Eubacteriales bacterium]
MTVMMTMMDGSVSVDPQTGEETVMQGPENAWQSIGTLPAEDGEAMGGAGVFAMCNINMVFMGVAVFICFFISEDFRSGYAKNLFAVRAKKGEYLVSKTIAGFFCGALMLAAYFAGAIIGGKVSGLSFALGTLTAGNLFMCMTAKLFLMFVFVSIFVLVSVAAKQRAWLALGGSLAAGMLLFMMVPSVTPLDSGVMNVLLCLAGGALFAFGLGALGNIVLKKTSLV